MLLGRSRRKGSVAINVANIGRAIPSFAVIALGVIWLGIGFRPALIAMVLLAVPPIFTLRSPPCARSTRPPSTRRAAWA